MLFRSEWYERGYADSFENRWTFRPWTRRSANAGPALRVLSHCRGSHDPALMDGKSVGKAAIPTRKHWRNRDATASRSPVVVVMQPPSFASSSMRTNWTGRRTVESGAAVLGLAWRQTFRLLAR